MPVSLGAVLTFAFAFCICTVCQDDNTGIGGVEGERQLVRPLSRFEIARIAPALVKQSVDGRVTSPSEWTVLRKLQLQQVAFALNLDGGSIDAIRFLAGRV